MARDTLRALNARSNRQGLLHFAGHLLAIAITGLLVYLAPIHWVLLIPAMVLHGFAIVTLFAPMHECVHRTPFRSRWLNRGIGWIAGFGAFINSDYYYRYHHWHHRFTQDPDNDPELAIPKPRTLAEYAWRICGIPYWRGKINDMLTVSLGRVSHLPFIPAHGQRGVIWSMRAQAALYLLIILGSVLLKSEALLIYWLLPALLGQPLLRSITIAEHTHCSENANGLQHAHHPNLVAGALFHVEHALPRRAPPLSIDPLSCPATGPPPHQGKNLASRPRIHRGQPSHCGQGDTSVNLKRHAWQMWPSTARKR